MGEHVHNFAKSWEKHDGFIYEVNDLLLPQAIEDLQIGHHENILDHGCRNGGYTIRHFAKIAEKNDSRVYALESSKTMHEHSKEHSSHPNIIYLNKDLMDKDLSFGDDKIHKIFSLYMLSVVKDYKACLKKMYKILEKDGKAALLIFSKLECYNQFLKHLQAHPELDFFGKHFVVPDWVDKFWNNEDHIFHIENSVKEAGFTIERKDVHPLHTTFTTIADFSEFLIAGGMSTLGEKYLTPEGLYKKLHNVLEKFLVSKRKTILNVGKEDKRDGFIMDYEVTVIIAKK